MNQVILVARLSKEPDVRYGAESQMAVAKFSVAVDRKTKDKKADFINCVAFGKTAEFIEKYFHKGNKIGIVGHIQTGNYINKDGVKVYTTDVICDQIEFVEKAEKNPESSDDVPMQGFEQIPMDEIPF